MSSTSLHVYRVSNGTQQIDNGSMRDLRREKFLFQLLPDQPAQNLSSLQTLMQDVFKQPEIAQWQQYMEETDAATRAAAEAAGPTKLEAAVFTGANTQGALVFEVNFSTPHPSWQAFRQTRHLAFLAIVAALETKGIKLAHFPALPR